MATNRNRQQTDATELETFLKSINHDAHGGARPMMIPGFDSYAPSYVSDGADRQVIHGQLESNPRGDKQIP